MFSWAFSSENEACKANNNIPGKPNFPGIFLVRETGLEPVRHKHTHLKRACLPVPALAQINVHIIALMPPIVNLKFDNSLFFLLLMQSAVQKSQ